MMKIDHRHSVRAIALFVLTAVALSTTVVLAAGPGSPDGAKTKAQFEAIMANQWKHMVRGTTGALAEPQTAANLATFTRNYYKSLIDEGFSADEAMALVGRVSFPIGGSTPTPIPQPAAPGRR